MKRKGIKFSPKNTSFSFQFNFTSSYTAMSLLTPIMLEQLQVKVKKFDIYVVCSTNLHSHNTF